MDEDPWRRWQAYSAQFQAPGFSRGWPGATGWPGNVPFGPPGESAVGGALGGAALAGAFERFSSAAQAHFDALSKAPAQPSADAMRDFHDALRDLFVDFPMPWSGAPITGDGRQSRSAPLGDLPAMGPNREHQLRWQRMAAAWGRIGDAQRRLQRLWADALRDAVAAFVARPDMSHIPAAGPEVMYELYGKWVDWVEDAYSRMAHSEPFCNALADAVNAGSEWRREIKIELEHAAKLLDVPTRSEVDSLTRRLNRVEAELRALQSRRRKARP